MNTPEGLTPLPSSTIACELLPVTAETPIEENELSSENMNPSLAPGYILDPIFGDIRQRTKLDDFPDSPKRLWNMWRHRPFEERCRRVPRGYRQGHSGLEYEEWLEDTQDRWENTSLGQNLSGDNSDGSTTCMYFSTQEEKTWQSPKRLKIEHEEEN
jgi:hypothetical protein